MELDKIEALLEKYLEGQTSLEEESRLRSYFGSANVAPELLPYKPMFMYYDIANTEKSEKQLFFQVKKKENSKYKWLSIAAVFLVLLAFSYPYLLKEEKAVAAQEITPEMAFQQTQKALALLSRKVNTGINSVDYLGEYQIAKEKVFITN